MSSAECGSIICCPRYPQISSAKCDKLFTFKNTARLMRDNLFMGLTSQAKPGAVSSRAQALFLPSWALGSSHIRVQAFFKILILCLNPQEGEMATADGLDAGAGCTC